MLVAKAQFELPWTVSRLIGPPPNAMCKPGKGSSRGSPGGQVTPSKRPAANGFVALPNPERVEPIRFDWRIVRERNFFGGLLLSSLSEIIFSHGDFALIQICLTPNGRRCSIYHEQTDIPAIPLPLTSDMCGQGYLPPITSKNTFFDCTFAFNGLSNSLTLRLHSGKVSRFLTIWASSSSNLRCRKWSSSAFLSVSSRLDLWYFWYLRTKMSTSRWVNQ